MENNYESGRRRQARANADVTSQSEMAEIEQAKAKEEQRRMEKEMRQMEIEESGAYQAVALVSKYMDDYYLDPLIGFIPVAGDFVSTLAGLPAIYVSLCVVRSIPLTLAVVFNILMDMVLGYIPFFIGDLIDIFNKSNKKNLSLIRGFVEDDKQIISEVNGKAMKMVVGIVVFLILLYYVISLAISAADWFSGLFS